jgi:hypothetical protein
VALSERLAIIITANGAGAIQEFRRIETSAARSVGKAETTAGKFKANASRIGAGMLIVGAAVAAGMRVAVAEAEEAARVGRQTDAVIRSTGGAANVTRAHLEGLAGSLSKVAAVDDEVIQSAGNVLLTFKSVANQTGEGAQIFDRATTAALDMSAALGTDVQSSILALGKALSNPVQGLTSLRRAGVDFTAQQREQVAAMVAVGDTLGAQQLIMAEVESQFAGSAEANATATDRMGVAWGNFLEKIGGPTASALEGLAVQIEDPLQMYRDFSTLLDSPLEIEFDGETLSRMAAELGIGKQALEGFAKEGEDAAAAVEELSDAIDIYLGQQFDVPEATREAGESFAEMITKFTDGESTWADQAAAQQEYVTGVAGVVTAMSEQGASQQAVDDALRSNIGSLRAARDAGQITGEQFVTLRDQILGIPHGRETRVTTPGAREALQAARDLKMSIELVPIKKSVPVRLEGAQQALGEAWGIKDRLEAIPKSTTVWVNIKTTGSAKISARGGPLGAGELSIVGEEGPEMFVPNTGGNIIPAMQTAKLMMGGGGPGPAPVGGSAAAGIVVNIHGSATKADGQAVVDALRRWQQRNGPVPVKVNG